MVWWYALIDAAWAPTRHQQLNIGVSVKIWFTMVYPSMGLSIAKHFTESFLRQSPAPSILTHFSQMRVPLLQKRTFRQSNNMENPTLFSYIFPYIFQHVFLKVPICSMIFPWFFPWKSRIFPLPKWVAATFAPRSRGADPVDPTPVTAGRWPASSTPGGIGIGIIWRILSDYMGLYEIISIDIGINHQI